MDVTVIRNGSEKTFPVTLDKLESYAITDLGLEVRNISKSELKTRGLTNGVIVTRSLNPEIGQYKLEGIIITKINDLDINTIEDVQSIITKRNKNTPIKITFMDNQGTVNSFIFR